MYYKNISYVYFILNQRIKRGVYSLLFLTINSEILINWRRRFYLINESFTLLK